MARHRENQAQHRSVLAKMVMKAFELWKVTNEDQLALLGLALENRAALSRYRRGEPLAAKPGSPGAGC